MAQIAHSSAS